MSSPSISSESGSSSSTSKSANSGQKPSKNRHHDASSFLGFSIRFMEKEKQKGRRFRTVEQGVEAASLKWASLSEDEIQQWKQYYRGEKDACSLIGDTKFKVPNGDRGVRLDTTQLAKLKDSKSKSSSQIRGLVDRWRFIHEDTADLKNEHFLIVSAKPSNTSPCAEIGIVEFSFGGGVLDDFHIFFGDHVSADVVEARYKTVRLILDWPTRIKRKLGDSLPNFFVPKGQTAAVFNALTYIDPSTPDFPPMNWKEKPQLSLAQDLATVDDLRAALFNYLKKPKSDEMDVPVMKQLSDDSTEDAAEDEELDCLETAKQCAMELVKEFNLLQAD